MSQARREVMEQPLGIYWSNTAAGLMGHCLSGATMLVVLMGPLEVRLGQLPV